MTAFPTLSVVMPVYNSSAVMRQTIDSVLAQSFKDFELICVDDGSEDDSLLILSQYANDDNRVRVFSAPSSGAANARNYGLSKASGTYVIFLDSDDYFSSKMFDEMVNGLVESGADLCICESIRFNHQTNVSEPHFSISSNYHDGLYQRKSLGRDTFQIGCQVPWNKMVRRKLLMSAGIRFQDIPNNDDALYSALVVWNAESVYFLHKRLVFYRWGAGTSLQDCECDTPEGALLAAEAVYGAIHEGCHDDVGHSLFECCLNLAIASMRVAMASHQYSRALHSRLTSDLICWHAAEHRNALHGKTGYLLTLDLLTYASYEQVKWVYSGYIHRREIGNTRAEKVRLYARTMLVLISTVGRRLRG